MTHHSRLAKTVPIMCMLAIAGSASAQSLFVRSLSEPVLPGGADELRATSMFLVEPPEPRQFQIHDIIYIIINENSIARSQQSLASTKVNQSRNRLNGIIDPFKLLELQLEASSVDSLQLMDLQVQNQYQGEGEYDRNDQIIARIAAEVIDVKPNGNIVLQAKKTVSTDQENKTVMLSGVARQEDVTLENTLLSNQIADLRIDMQHEGELPRSANKGIITRALEALFAF